MNNNQLQIFNRQFEGTGVEIIQDEKGEPLFELYSVGSALGYSKIVVSKGKEYLTIRKDRIDIVMRNADITGFPHDGKTYLTESDLYDFMLEAKTDKVKPFRKWVTSEVLPSLRKHGQYSITTNDTNDMIVNLVNNTVASIIPVITTEMAKVVVQSQEQVKQAINLINDQSQIYDLERQNIKDLIGFRTINTSKIVNTIKEKLTDKIGKKIMANNPIFQKVKKEVFKEFDVIKWEDLPVEKYSKVYAFVDTYIEEEIN